MSKFVIERDLPGAGQLTADELQAIAQKSVEVLDSMAGRAQWLQSYVTDDKLFCIYIADNEATVQEHAIAQPGEVYATSTVRDLVAGSGIEFADRGLHTLKGIPGDWAVLAAVT